MRIIRNNIIPPQGFCALNFLGLILFVKTKCNITEKTLNHENIHSAQYKELWYIGFLILYLYYWIKNLMKGSNNAYRDIPFEKECYANDTNFSYLETRKKFAWKDYR